MGRTELRWGAPAVLSCFGYHQGQSLGQVLEGL